MNIAYRPAEITDLSLIYSTWTKSLYFALYKEQEVDPVHTYYPNATRAIQSILERSNVAVACLEDQPDVVLGYCVFEGFVLRWIYMKKVWRKQGIAKKLIAYSGAKAYSNHIGKRSNTFGLLYDPLEVLK